jgi:predicted dithiol-disulfide oxidoreductase (DUF899 family)
MSLKNHKVVSQKEWASARKKLLLKEKIFTRRRDALSQARRDLPWVEVQKPYLFDGPKGKESLSKLFAGKSQLIVYHFMFAPEWSAGCPHCSFWADNFNDIIVHLNQRDAAMVAVSRAPLKKIAAFKKRMGWDFKWLSSFTSDFNYDLGVSFKPSELKTRSFNCGTQQPGMTDREGASVFYKDAKGRIFRTYSTYGRGIDLMNTAYNYLDLCPKGRDENGRGQFWVKHHDKYPARR